MRIGLSTIKVAIILILTLSAGPAAAYVGPGAGVSLVGAAGGLVLAIFTAIGIVLRHLIKRPLARHWHRRTGRQVESTAETGVE